MMTLKKSLKTARG